MRNKLSINCWFPKADMFAIVNFAIKCSSVKVQLMITLGVVFSDVKCKCMPYVCVFRLW